jgi:long-chain acyl-CoA synthetase
MIVNITGEPWREHYAHACAWDLDLPPLSLVEMFESSAAAHPERPLVNFEGRSFSYSALLDESRRFACGLKSWGVLPGERVGLFLPNVPTYVPAYFGALMAGATVVNFSPLYTAAELEAQVLDSGTRLLVTLDVPALLPTATEVLYNSPLKRLIVVRLADLLPPVMGLALKLFGRRRLAKVPRAPEIGSWRLMLGQPLVATAPIDPQHDLALLQYTGGTTGTPKGAMLSHQNLSVNARQLRAVDPDRDRGDVVLGQERMNRYLNNT